MLTKFSGAGIWLFKLSLARWHADFPPIWETTMAATDVKPEPPHLYSGGGGVRERRRGEIITNFSVRP